MCAAKMFCSLFVSADNVLLSGDAEVKLADFGLVADYPDAVSSKGYATKVGYGSASYVSHGRHIKYVALCCIVGEGVLHFEECPL